MPRDICDATAGLGTTIVSALTKQFDATVKATPTDAVTRVIVHHTNPNPVDPVGREPKIEAV